MTESLPDEILLAIFVHLTHEKDRLSALRVCQQWRRVGFDRGMWRRARVSLRAALVLVNRLPDARDYQLHLIVDSRNEGCVSSTQRTVEANEQVYGLERALLNELAAVTLREYDFTESTERCSVLPFLSDNCTAIEFERCQMRDATESVLSLIAKRCRELHTLSIHGNDIHPELITCVLSLPLPIVDLVLFVPSLMLDHAFDVHPRLAEHLESFTFHSFAQCLAGCMNGTRFPRLRKLLGLGMGDGGLFLDNPPPNLTELRYEINRPPEDWPLAVPACYPNLTSLALVDSRPAAHLQPCPIDPARFPILINLSYSSTCAAPLDWWRTLFACLPLLERVTMFTKVDRVLARRLAGLAVPCGGPRGGVHVMLVKISERSMRWEITRSDETVSDPIDDYFTPGTR